MAQSAAAAPPPTAAPPPAAPAALAPRADEAPPAIAPELVAAAQELMISKGCVGCHTIAALPVAAGSLGPDLSHIATQASATIASPAYKSSKGQATTVEEYLRESILTPGTFVYPDCPLGPCPDFVMPRDFKTRLKPEELELILSLLTSLE